LIINRKQMWARSLKYILVKNSVFIYGETSYTGVAFHKDRSGKDR